MKKEEALKLKECNDQIFRIMNEMLFVFQAELPIDKFHLVKRKTGGILSDIYLDIMKEFVYDEHPDIDPSGK